MTKLTLALTLNNPHNDAQAPSVSRSPLDENNDIVSRSWIVYGHGIVKLTVKRETYFCGTIYRRRRFSHVLLLWVLS